MFRKSSINSDIKVFTIGAHLLHRLAYFTPLIGFILAWPALARVGGIIDLQIYLLALLFVIILAFNAGTRAIVKVEALHITFYHLTTSRFYFCYLSDIRHIEARPHTIIIHQIEGHMLTSPYLTKKQLRQLIDELRARGLTII